MAFPRGNNARGFVTYAGNLYFTAVSDTLGLEIWVTDGTTNGTRVAIDLNPGAGSSSPGYSNTEPC